MHLKSLLILLFLSLSLGILVAHTYSSDLAIPRFTVGLVNYAFEKENENEKATTSILFTGDVMLARDVERISSLIDYEHPLLGVEDILARHDKKVINFEGSIPKVHQPTPSMQFQFSVSSEFLASLAKGGISYASLANNHSFDFGQSGHDNTKRMLNDSGIISFGSYNNNEEELLTHITTDQGSIALFGAHVVYEYPHQEKLIEAIQNSESTSDLQVLYVHWGEEYELVHDERQQEFAERVIDAGIDLIIGHHPHVVQDVQLYKGVPIFYSLGNFIFDQYFDEEVQAGLLLGLNMTERDKFIELIPVSSIGSKVQPRPMAGYERRLFLEALSERSSPDLREALVAGRIEF